MHLRRKSVPSGKVNRIYYSICQTYWDSETKSPRERTILYLGKTPLITEEKAKEKGIPIEELKALTRRSVLRIGIRTDILPDRLKSLIKITKKRIPASVWHDFKRLGFHIAVMMSNKAAGTAQSLDKTYIRPYAGSKANKLVILLSPEMAFEDDDDIIQCAIAEEIIHQYAHAKRWKHEDVPPRGIIEEEVWILHMLRQWGFSEEEVKHFASSKNWLGYATMEWGETQT